MSEEDRLEMVAAEGDGGFNPDDYQSPPHDGAWSDNFIINKAWVDRVTTSWRNIPNSGGLKIRRVTKVIYIKDDATAYMASYKIEQTAFYYDVEVYIAERIS